MTATLSLLILLAQGSDGIQFIGDGFRIQVGGRAIFQPLNDPAKRPQLVAAFRERDRWVVWDERGLTIRSGRRVKTTRLRETPVSRKLFEPDQIRANRAGIRKGALNGMASALSGARRFGDDVYLLLRWNDRTGRPWLEALHKVNIKAPGLPAPQLVGKFEFPSIAAGPVGFELVSLDGKPAAVVRSPDGWGVSTYDPATETFSTVVLGGDLLRFERVSSRLGVFFERTAWGATLVGTADLGLGLRSELFETRGRVELVSRRPPFVFRRELAGESWLRNAETGAEMRLPRDSQARATELGVLVWYPSSKPESATLYDPSRWSFIVGMPTMPRPFSGPARAQPQSKSAVLRP